MYKNKKLKEYAMRRKSSPHTYLHLHLPFSGSLIVANSFSKADVLSLSGARETGSELITVTDKNVNQVQEQKGSERPTI